MKAYPTCGCAGLCGHGSVGPGDMNSRGELAHHSLDHAKMTLPFQRQGKFSLVHPHVFVGPNPRHLFVASDMEGSGKGHF